MYALRTYFFHFAKLFQDGVRSVAANYKSEIYAQVNNQFQLLSPHDKMSYRKYDVQQSAVRNQALNSKIWVFITKSFYYSY
jgi:hypothetical protein